MQVITADFVIVGGGTSGCVVAARLAEVRGSAEAAEGMMAFMEKRKPKWVG